MLSCPFDDAKVRLFLIPHNVFGEIVCDNRLFVDEGQIIEEK
jgi:hypothetical protein